MSSHQKHAHINLRLIATQCNNKNSPVTNYSWQTPGHFYQSPLPENNKKDLAQQQLQILTVSSLSIAH